MSQLQHYFFIYLRTLFLTHNQIPLGKLWHPQISIIQGWFNKGATYKDMLCIGKQQNIVKYSRDRTVDLLRSWAHRSKEKKCLQNLKAESCVERANWRGPVTFAWWT